MKVVILRSVENQYVRLVGVPDEMPIADAIKKIEEIIAKVKAENPDDWSWEQMEPAFEEAGLINPEWTHGPYWDE